MPCERGGLNLRLVQMEDAESIFHLHDDPETGMLLRLPRPTLPRPSPYFAGKRRISKRAVLLLGNPRPGR